ncbi:MAG: MFS transporter [Anaerolineae bacterium]|nr:MFS transporter [Anaerolineae bacterium]
MFRNPRFLFYALIYFAEGAILSYFTALNAIYLLGFDLSLSQIGLVGAIALIPFVLKIFLVMLSDRVNLFQRGHRKPYIIIGLLTQAVCLFIVPAIHPGEQFWLFALLAFLLMTGQALYDTCTDGLALDSTAPEEEGTVQGIMVGGRALGVVVISAAIGLVAQNASWSLAFYALGVLSLIPLPMALTLQEAPRAPEKRFVWSAFSAFTNPAIIALGILGALYSLITNAANQLVNPFLQAEFNINISTAGLFTTVWGIGVILGGLSGGRLVDRIGQQRAVLLALAVATLSITGLALIFSPAVAWLLVAVFGLAFGYFETVYFAVSMRATDPRIAASMFAILMAVANLGTGIGLALSGSLADAVGFRNTFFIIAALNILALPLLAVIFKRKVVEIEPV